VIIEELDEFTASVPVIDDGDTCGNFEHKQTAQALANRTKNLKGLAQPVYDLMTGAKTSVSVGLDTITADLSAVPFPNESAPFNALNPPGVMGRGLARWIKAAHDAVFGLRAGDFTTWSRPVQCIAPAALTKWDAVADATIGLALAQVTADSTPLYLQLPLPGIAGYIKQVGITVNGGAGHGALPATKPRLRLIRSSVNTGIVTDNEVAGANDSSVDVTAYQQLHTIVLTGLSIAVTPAAGSLWTYLKVTGESGASSINGEFKIGGVFVVTNPNP
jgi:hypothetical protein